MIACDHTGIFYVYVFVRDEGYIYKGDLVIVHLEVSTFMLAKNYFARPSEILERPVANKMSRVAII